MPHLIRSVLCFLHVMLPIKALGFAPVLSLDAESDALFCRRRHRRVSSDLGGGTQVGIPMREQNILDGDLLWSFVHLPRSRQLALAASIGALQGDVMAALHELACSLLYI